MNRPGELVEIQPAILRHRDVHRQEDPGRRVDGHRHADVLEVDAVEEPIHVLEQVDGDTLPPYLPTARRMVGVVAHQRRHVEVDGQTGLTLRDQIPEPLVGLIRRPEPCDLTHRPDSTPIHGGVRAPGERVPARQTDIFKWNVGDVRGRVHPLDGPTRAGQVAVLGLRAPLEEVGELTGLPSSRPAPAPPGGLRRRSDVLPGRCPCAHPSACPITSCPIEDGRLEDGRPFDESIGSTRMAAMTSVTAACGLMVRETTRSTSPLNRAPPD